MPMFNINLETLLLYAFILAVVFPFLQFAHKFIKLKNKELSLLASKKKSISPMKLQAYERMIIFLERLKPSYLIGKFDEKLNTKELVFLLDKNIKEEFEYNISQQLYIGEESWNNIVNSKNNMLHLLHKILETNPHISSQEFKTLLLMSYMENEDYISNSIENLKSDIHHLI